MNFLKGLFLSALLLSSTMFVSSCNDDDDDSGNCLVCEAFDDGNGLTIEAIDICVGEDGVTQEDLDTSRAVAETLGASCN